MLLGLLTMIEVITSVLLGSLSGPGSVLSPFLVKFIPSVGLQVPICIAKYTKKINILI